MQKIVQFFELALKSSFVPFIAATVTLLQNRCTPATRPLKFTMAKQASTAAVSTTQSANASSIALKRKHDDLELHLLRESLSAPQPKVCYSTIRFYSSTVFIALL